MIISDIIVYDGVTLLTQESPTPPSIATPVTLPVALECVPSASLVNVLNNVAWYYFTLGSTTTVVFDTGDSVGPPDTMVGVYDSTGALLGYDDDSGPGYSSYLVLTDLAPGTYYIAAGYYYITYGVSDWNAVGDSELFDDCTIKLNVIPLTPPPYSLPIILTHDSSIDNYAELTFTGSNVNVLIDWGDGNTSQAFGSNVTENHTYGTANTYTITAYGQANGLETTYLSGLTAVNDWGDLVGFDSLAYTLYGATNLTSVPANIPANVTNTYSLFAYCSNLNDSNIVSWNVGNVTTMRYMFSNAYTFNQNIASWTTSNVTDMGYMFAYANTFNQNVASWNTTNVTDINGMFTYATAFNQNIGVWDTSNITDMGYTFSNATAFNQNIGSWNTSNVTSMSSMFQGANVFNQNIGSWNTSNVVYMNYMFNNAKAFNQNINSWDTSNVTSMNYMFNDATSFNQNLNSWNTGNVTGMIYMFATTSGNGPFNGNISNWDTSNVTSMNWMFSNANTFNQPIGNWNTSNVVTFGGMFNNAKAFNQSIGNWNTSKAGYNTGYYNYAMASMFRGASAFNQDIGNWNTSNLNGWTSVDYMFGNATAFNQNLYNWCVPNVYWNDTFDSGATSWTQLRPLFGLCPANTNLAPMTMTYNPALGSNAGIGFGGYGYWNELTSAVIDWGDGNIQNWYNNNTSQLVTHNYGANTSIKTISVKGKGNVILFNTARSAGYTAITDWGNIQGYQVASFCGAVNLTNVPNTLPSTITDLSIVSGGAFQNCASFNDANITSWNTSNVVNMTGLFRGATNFNQNIGSWNTSNVTLMSYMFNNATSFNQNIGGWNTSKVTSMSSMFEGATAFNQDLNSWNTSNVSDYYSMQRMFRNATSFNGNISAWNTSNVGNLYQMFEGASSFNSNISSWNISKVTDVSYMFFGASSFNQDIGNWNTANISSSFYMTGMFSNATVFNQNLTGWCVTNITSEPSSFSNGSALTGGNKPVWGTCPP